MLISPSYAAARWKALGSYVGLVVADQNRLDLAETCCRRILDQVDHSCSRFRGDSDLTRANQAAGRWVRVSPMLIQAVTQAIQAALATDGLVDPTLGGSLVALGYDRDLEELAELQAVEPLESPELTASPGPQDPLGFVTGPLPSGIPAEPDAWRRIEIDPDGAIRVPEGVALDLGATGKAFAADLIAETVPALAGTSLIISLGGDVSTGGYAGESGESVSDRFQHPWRVDVGERPEDVVSPDTTTQDATRHDGETVVLTEGGIATSSVLARRWRHGGAWVHHLLDPRTGRPVQPIWRTASVCATSCLEANAASTAAIVMGASAPDWLAERDLAARLVAADGGVLRLAGWPEAGE